MSDMCQETVPGGGRSVRFHRCRKKAVSDGYYLTRRRLSG